MDFFNYYTNYNNYYLPRENTPWILDFTNKSFQYNLNTAVSMIRDSVNDEAEDAAMYDSLINIAPNNEAKEIIQNIRDDEKIHNRLLREIFTELTGVVLPQNTVTQNYEKTNYIDGIKKSFTGELKAVEKYREILTYMPNKQLYDKILYIMTDEMKHAMKYNYLITMYLENKATNVAVTRLKSSDFL